MTQACQVCNHVSRLEIDRLLVQNKSLALLSRQYGMSRASLTNHRKNHLSKQLVQAQQTRDLFVSKNMFSLIEDLLSSSLNILSKCEKKLSKYNTALKAISESRKTCEFLYEVSISLKQIQVEEERQKIQNDTATHKKMLERLSDDELDTLARLNQKMSGLEQGRRNDLLLTKARHRTNQKKVKLAGQKRYRGKKKITIRRRKVVNPEPEKPDEFDAMRTRLGMDNNPEPIKETSWMGS